MTFLNSTLRAKAQSLLRTLNQEPDLIVQIKAPREIIELKAKPKAGEKIHTPKPAFRRPVDFEAVDLKADLDLALQSDDFELMAVSYYTLAYLLSY